MSDRILRGAFFVRKNKIQGVEWWCDVPNWDLIKEEWKTSDITFKDLAEKHGIKDSTIRSRKNREKWQCNNEPKKVQRATQRKQNVATKKEEYGPVVESDNLTDKQRLFLYLLH